MTLFSNLLVSLAIFASCSHVKSNIDAIKEKKAPEYQGVATPLQPFVTDYFYLAGTHNIHFTKQVTIGFKKLSYPREKETTVIVGLCHYGSKWREIDIDQEFWDRSNEESRKILIFHELTHCYCERAHDWAKDRNYPENSVAILVQSILVPIGLIAPGFWNDNCPMSIMYPSVLSNQCFQAHDKEYLTEMFDRCQPW